MAIRYKGFKITGLDSDTAWDKGLSSSETEKYKLLYILVHVVTHIGNEILVDYERDRLANLYDYHFDTDEQNTDTNTPRSTTKLNRIDVDRDIPIGKTIMVGFKCGTAEADLYGAYVYELK